MVDLQTGNMVGIVVYSTCRFRHQILIPEAMRSGAASFQQGALEQ